MLDTAFYFILNMSITASIIGLILMVLRKTRLIPAYGAYLLWGLVFLRLVLPLSFSSSFSIFNLTGNLVKKVVHVPAPVGQYDLTISNAIGAAESYLPVSYKENRLKNILELSAHVWIIIAVAAILAASVLYFLTSSELKQSSRIRGRLYQSEKITSPVVFGILRPRIVVPSSLMTDQADLDHIMLHESVHIKRLDNLWRLVAVIVCCIHWFNPLAWLFLKYFLEDMELACDAKAIKTLTGSERKEYAKTLLQFGTGQSLLMSTSFGGSKTRVRIQQVITYRKLTTMAIIFTGAFLLVLSYILVTNPVK